MSQNDDDEKLAGLDAWEPMAPPAGFADRVMQVHQNAATRDPGAAQPRRWVRALVGTALLGSMAALWLLAARAGDGSGEAAPLARASLLIGRRGVAVAEAGAQLRWQVKSGMVQVHQNAGDVFYRVEHGGAFVVSTPAGDATVQGTCFRVEVGPMMRMSKQTMVAAGVGAVVATTMLVTVYEGRVLLANEHGKTTLSAGERASASSGQSPGAAENAAVAQKSAVTLAAPADGVTRDELLTRDQAQRIELEKLRARVHELEVAQPGAAADKSEKKKDSFVDLSKEELQALAKDCKLKWDHPAIGVNPQTMGQKRAGELGLSEQERAEINRVNADVNQHVVRELRALYLEVTGDKGGADALTPQALENEIMSKSPDALVQQTFYRLSHERAGLQAPPAGANGEPPVERLMRMMTTLGDDYEQKLGAAIGPDRAHQLRADGGGWNSRSQSSYGCPE